MIHSKLFEYVPETGITRMFHYDDDLEEIVIETWQEVGDLIENNKAQYNSIDERARYTDDVTRMASLPLHIFMELRKKGIIEDGDPKQKKFLKWLNDRDNQVFRTRPGRM